MKNNSISPISPYRQLFLLSVIGVGFIFVILKLVELQLYKDDFLQQQGEIRAVRTIGSIGHRGVILDRNSVPLAVSSLAKSVYVDPSLVNIKQKNWFKLAKIIGVSANSLHKKISSRKHTNFIYLKRHVTPKTAGIIQQLELKGLYLASEFKRYYPQSEVLSHVIGTTDLDNNGIQGLELSYNTILSGKDGKKTIIKDRYGSKVEGLSKSLPAEKGQNILISIDSRIQYIAYKELLKAITKHKASSGSVVMLKVATGEVLAMVNYPSFNPNVRYEKIDDRFRNRAVMDQYEPGSSIKPFSMVNILKSGKFYPSYKVDTSPGWLKVGSNKVKDVRNYGQIGLGQIIQKSSNVGISKLTLKLEPYLLYETMQDFGFGRSTNSGFPGEAKGSLSYSSINSSIGLATLAFGYGVSVTPLQLAQAYSMLAAGGKKCPISYLRASTVVYCQQVISPTVVAKVNKMLQSTTEQNGTGYRAAVSGYQVAGKTGTVRKLSANGYNDSSHVAIFAGFAPYKNPEVAMVVLVDDPKVGGYYGGEVAAPVFSKIMAQTLSWLDILPDYSKPNGLILAHR